MTTMKEMLAAVSSPSADVPSRIAKNITAKALHDSVQNIGGFPVTDHLLVHDRMKVAQAQRVAAIAAFNGDKAHLLTKMNEIGITEYLAVVPTNYWKNICDRHGLVTANPNMDGKVNVNTKVPHQIAEAVQKYWSTAGNVFGGFAIALTICAFITWLCEAQSIALLSVSVAFICFLINCSLTGIGKKLGARAVSRYIKSTPYAKLVADLLTPSEYQWSRSQVQLTLPAPPIDIVLLLRKLRDHRELFSVTAEPSALQFNPSVEKLYQRGYEIEMERIAKEKLDPIITISFNDATVVLAQFGNFKWEKEVIEEIVSSVPMHISSREY